MPGERVSSDGGEKGSGGVEQWNRIYRIGFRSTHEVLVSHDGDSWQLKVYPRMYS